MVKKLLKSVREFKLATILTPLFMLGEVLMEVFIPFLMAKLIDLGIEKGSMDNIIKVGLLLVGCSLFSLLFGMLSGKYASIASNGFAKNLRHDMYYNVQNFSFKNIDKYSTSSIITRLTTDVTNVQNSYQMCIRIAVRAPLIFLFSLIMSFKINAQIASIYILMVPLVFIVLLVIAKIAFPYFEKVFKTYDELNTVVKENVSGIRVVKAYVQENHEINKFSKVSEKIYALFTKAEKIVCANSAIMDFAMYASMILISYLGAKCIVGGTLTTGELTSFINYSMMILMSLIMLSSIFVMIIISLPSMKRVVEILEEKSDINSPDKPLRKIDDGSIKFIDVDFSYSDSNEKLSLKDIDIEIESGDTIGIIGSTGAGKSTLVNMIPRLYDPLAGKVLVGGRNVKDYDLDILRSEVAMVLQKNVLFSGTIRDNLKWGNEKATDDEIYEALKISEAYKFVSEFPGKLDYMIDQGATNVSGGQKQRLCIARTLLKNPKIIIFDDSTSACDTVTDAKIRNGLKEFNPKLTKIIIAQRVDSIIDADKVIVLDKGRVIAFDTPSNLMDTCEIYKEVYNSQKKGVN